MDTPDQGASIEETVSGDSSIEQTEEITPSETSEDGTQQEDADIVQKRLADKDRHIEKLERELREAKPKKKSEPEDDDDVITWASMNSDSLKLVGKEYQEELAFYKTHKIPITNDIRDRALRDARARKGVRNTEAERQVATSAEVQGEMRKAPRITGVPESVKEAAKNAGVEITPEKYAKYKAEFDARKKRS